MENKVFIKKETMKGIADAIRAKDGTTEEIAVTDMADRIGAIETGGVDFSAWGNIRLCTLNCFQSSEAVINLPRGTSLESLCDRQLDTTGTYTNTTVEHLTVNCPNAITSFKGMLQANNEVGEGKLKRLTLNVDTSAAKAAASAFYNCNKLEIIDGTPIDLSSINADGNIYQLFHMCYKLAEVRFKGIIKASLSLNKLQQITKATIDSVVSCLSDDVSGKSVSFNEMRINSLYETSSGAADGANSTEWATVIGRKPNWTFVLSF